uniref:Uncharacterized protein n=1 Tax=Micrurus surinamensis TaxID=129470 RepID=A0A2D4P7F4_MICSU
MQIQTSVLFPRWRLIKKGNYFSHNQKVILKKVNPPPTNSRFPRTYYETAIIETAKQQKTLLSSYLHGEIILKIFIEGTGQLDFCLVYTEEPVQICKGFCSFRVGGRPLKEFFFFNCNRWTSPTFDNN